MENDPSSTVPAGDGVGHAAVSKLPLYAMGALVVLVILAALAIGLRGNKEFAAGTPEAAVQDYLAAALEADDEATITALEPARRPACRTALSERNGSFRSSGIGFELDSMTETGATARAQLTRRSGGGGDLFESSVRTSDQTIELTKLDGQWYVSSTTWPNWIRRCLDQP